MTRGTTTRSAATSRYIQTDEFTAALEDLRTRASNNGTAIMCADALPWRCHRSLMGDTLVVLGVEILALLSKTTATTHTSFARVDGATITCPGTEIVS